VPAALMTKDDLATATGWADPVIIAVSLRLN
jgi:hypothetical protein